MFCGQFRGVAVALGDDISDHNQDLEWEEGKKYKKKLRFYLIPPKEHDRIRRDICDPIKDFSEEGALIIFPCNHSIKVVEYNANHEDDSRCLRRGGEEVHRHIV